jgi:hypothetical protein
MCPQFGTHLSQPFHATVLTKILLTRVLCHAEGAFFDPEASPVHHGDPSPPETAAQGDNLINFVKTLALHVPALRVYVSSGAKGVFPQHWAHGKFAPKLTCTLPFL